MKTEIFQHQPLKAEKSTYLSNPVGAWEMESNDLYIEGGKSYIIEGNTLNDIYLLLENGNKFHLEKEQYKKLFNSKPLVVTYQIVPESNQDVFNLTELLGNYQLFGNYPLPKQNNNMLIYKPFYIDQILRIEGDGTLDYYVRFLDFNRIKINPEIANVLTGINVRDEYA